MCGQRGDVALYLALQIHWTVRFLKKSVSASLSSWLVSVLVTVCVQYVCLLAILVGCLGRGS